MSLTASVMCQCLDSLSVPAKFQNHLHINDHGFLCIQLPLAGHEKLHNQFETWMMRACDHEEMALKSEPIASDADLHRFQHLLEEAHQATFPALFRAIQQTNNGLTSSQSAEQMLSELATFATTVHTSLKTVLFNSDTGSPIWEYIPEYGCEIESNSIEGLSIGVDAHGFFIQSMAGEEHFRSQQFNQTVHNPNTAEARVCYTDGPSGQQFECHTPITGRRLRWPNGKWQNERGQIRFEYPDAMHTERRAQETSDLSYVIDALTSVCVASVATGNPIRWQRS